MFCLARVIVIGTRDYLKDVELGSLLHVRNNSNLEITGHALSATVTLQKP